VSWQDASAYAAWLSHETGMHFRLPTDEEWAYAAAERFSEDTTPQSELPTDPGRRALARYESESSRSDTIVQTPQTFGSFGANTNGLLDMAGNVWEWTDSCFHRSALDAGGRASGATTVNCGVRVVEGRHRTYMTDFIRDARAGGCSAGTPPSNLGFRLVRDDAAPSLVGRIRGFIGPRG
jgi:formylglycine-generating enzyme required for sulfatase activity